MLNVFSSVIQGTSHIPMIEILETNTTDWYLNEKGKMVPPPCTFLQYHYLMCYFVYPFWVLKTGPVFLMGQHWMAFKKEHSPIHFLIGLAAPVWKVRVLCYEFTDVTLAWEDGQWVEAHKIILAGCSPKNMNTHNIRTQIFGRIRIRIIFGPKFLDKYE